MSEDAGNAGTTRKKASAVAAVMVAAALALGGTFAWQSISQTALNEASDVVNPGGRLHDDFNGSNKDVYVENFAEEDIFARIRLEEFFEITQAGGTVHSIAGERDADGNVSEYALHNFGEEILTDAYWDWQTGGSTVYMPTFNKNKDSLEADVNGTYNGLDGTVTNETTDDRYTDYVKYAYGEERTDSAIYDYDSNDVDEVGADLENAANYPSNVTTVSEEHTAKNTLGAKLISMDEWMALAKDEQVGEYWVYDTDGWVYWAAPIEPGTATGLLLDGIKLDEKLDDSWYYAINVIAQFVTADDVGKTDGTGFYDTTKDLPAPSEDAETLLETIGVDMSGDNAGDSGVITDAGTIQGLNMKLNVSEENPYFKINESTNTLYIVEPDYGWHQVDVAFEHETLDIDLTETTRTVYLWDEAEGKWQSENIPFIVDPCFAKQLDILFDSEEAPGLYKVDVSYDDGEGSTYEGSIEFSIEIYEEPEEPEFFENLLISMSEQGSTSETYFDQAKCYATPGDTIEFGAAYMNSNFEEEGFKDVPDAYLTWSVSGNTSNSTTISDTGLLTVGVDEPSLSVLTVSVTYTNENQGIEISKDHYVMVSDEDIALTLRMNSSAPYYVNAEYAFTATAATASGKSVDMEWVYSLYASDSDESLNAQVEGSSFTASDGGKYTLKAYAQYLPGRNVSLEIDVLGIGYVALWDNLEDVETKEPDYKLYESTTINNADTLYYARIYDTQGNLITDEVAASGDCSYKSLESCKTDYLSGNDDFTASYYHVDRRGESGYSVFSWHDQGIAVELWFE